MENHARKGDLSPRILLPANSLKEGQVVRLLSQGELRLAKDQVLLDVQVRTAHLLNQTGMGSPETVPPATGPRKSAPPRPSNPKIQPMVLLRELQEAIMGRIRQQAGKHRQVSPEMGLKSRLGLPKAKVQLQKAKLAAKATLRAILGVVSH